MARQHADTAVISEEHKEVVNIRTAGAASKRYSYSFVFLFGRIV